MESLKRKLTRALAEGFPRAKVTIDVVTPLHILDGSGPRRDDYSMVKTVPAKLLEKFSGLVVWKGFEGLDQVDRQRQVWKVLRSQLSRDEQVRITAVLTLTPAER